MLKPLSRLFYIFAALVLVLVPVALLSSGQIHLPWKDNTSLAAEEKAKVFNAAQYRLENGLEVIVIENHRAPVVAHMVWYKVGAADEVARKSGVAHFMEHLMFKGSEGLAAGEFSTTIRRLGGNDNAFTSQDYTAYFQSIAKEHLPTVMRMEAGRMRGMNPADDAIISERQVILEERAQRTDNNPQARFQEQLDAALYLHHPYGTPVIGWRHEVETLDRDDVMAFYNHWYAPNNAVLVIAGAVTGEEVLALAQDIYGKIPQQETPQRVRTKSPPMRGENIVSMSDPAVHQPLVQMAYRVPSARQDYAQSLALQILTDIMGTGANSRLYKSLVVEQKIAANAGLYYRSDVWDDGKIVLYATPLPDVSLETLRAALENELRAIIKNGISEAERTEALARLQAQAIYARDSLIGPAMIVGRGMATGQSLEQIEYWPHDLEAITAADIIDTATLYLNPDMPRDIPPVIGYLRAQTPQEAAQ